MVFIMFPEDLRLPYSYSCLRWSFGYDVCNIGLYKRESALACLASNPAQQRVSRPWSLQTESLSMCLHPRSNLPMASNTLVRRKTLAAGICFPMEDDPLSGHGPDTALCTYHPRCSCDWWLFFYCPACHKKNTGYSYPEPPSRALKNTVLPRKP